MPGVVLATATDFERRGVPGSLALSGGLPAAHEAESPAAQLAASCGTAEDINQLKCAVIRHRERVQQVRELWLLREQARVRAAEFRFLSRLNAVIDQAAKRYSENARTSTLRASLERFRRAEEAALSETHEDYDGAGTELAQRERRSQFDGPMNILEQLRLEARVSSMVEEFCELERAVPDSVWISGLDRTQREHFPRQRSWLVSLEEQHNVTNALESQFRHQLERVLVERQSDVRNGNGVLPYYRRLHQLNEQQAEFARGGYYEAGAYEGDAIDHEFDSFEGTAARGAGSDRSMRGGSAELQRALDALRDEVHVLKNVVHSSFDMQLEIQRSVRQEVAAAMQLESVAQRTRSTESAASDKLFSEVRCAGIQRNEKHRMRSRGSCVVCCETAINCVLYACGHACACSVCARSLLSAGMLCPMCRAPVRDVVVVYEVDG